jgi:hypothetical protein
MIFCSFPHCCLEFFTNLLIDPCEKLTRGLLLKVRPQTNRDIHRNLLEMQIHGLHPRATDSESTFNKIPRGSGKEALEDETRVVLLGPPIG